MYLCRLQRRYARIASELLLPRQLCPQQSSNFGLAQAVLQLITMVLIFIENLFKHMHTHAFLYVFLFVLLSGITACKKEAEVIVPEVEEEIISWQPEPNILLADKILLNAYATENTFLVMGHKTLFTFSRSEERPSAALLSPVLPLIRKPALSKDFHLLIGDNENFLIFRHTANPWPYESRGKYLQDIDSTFTPEAHVAYMHDHRFRPYAFNNRNQCLVAVKETRPGSTVTFLLANLEVIPNDEPNRQTIHIASGKRIVMPWYAHQAVQVMAFEDCFLVSTNSYSALVYSDGRVKQIFDRGVTEYFTYNQQLYAIFPDGSGSRLMRSADKGETWQSFSDWPLDGWEQYAEFDGKLFMYMYSQIAHVDLEKGAIREIDNKGLEGNEITSVNAFNGKVYVTTLSGLFYIPQDQFLRYKNKDE
jgi:hypothetical protein